MFNNMPSCQQRPTTSRVAEDCESCLVVLLPQANEAHRRYKSHIMRNALKNIMAHGHEKCFPVDWTS